MQGKIKVNEHTSDVIVQLNGCDNLLESGSHEADIQSTFMTLELGVVEKKPQTQMDARRCCRHKSTLDVGHLKIIYDGPFLHRRLWQAS